MKLNKDKLKKITKNNYKKIIIILFIALIGGKLYVSFFGKDVEIFRNESCPFGQIMTHWDDYFDDGIKNVTCGFPEICGFGEKLTENCGVFPGYASCNTYCASENEQPEILKPVIYLYPQEKTDLKVELSYRGKLIADYPKYNYDINGWDVIAYPDSKVIDKTDDKEYSYLFWEGKTYNNINWNIDKGFVVKGSDSREFLQEILPKIGLTPKEYNEFIVFWYPIMQKNKYNLIHFAGTQYTDLAPLKTTPNYDSILRVFMVVKPLEKPIEIEPQTFEGFERKGFSIVEWGGTVIE